MTVLSRMSEFRSRTGTGAFPHIDRARFARELQQRIDDPNLIDQGPTSLCGPASLLRSLLMDNPEHYVSYAIDLYETGQAKLGKIRVKPGSDCREVNPGTKMAGVDWVTLASLRDSENDVFDYDDLDDEVGGITMPGDLAEWFEKVGYEDVRNVTSVLLNEGLNELSEALKLARSGMRVCLLIEADMIQRKKVNDSFANHWVMLENEGSWGAHSDWSAGLDDWYEYTHGPSRGPTATWGQPASPLPTWHDAPTGSSAGSPVMHWHPSPQGVDPRTNYVALTLWSWGDIYHTVDYNPDGIGRLTVPVFKKRFHGYVAGRFRYAY